MDSAGNMKWVVNGEWDNQIEIAPVISSSGGADNPVIKTGPYTVAWKRKMPRYSTAIHTAMRTIQYSFSGKSNNFRCFVLSPDSDKYYNFTELACQLNEPEDGVAPTDSRLRPDQRLMEKGDWDGANAQKVRLEEKQRAARRKKEEEAELAASKGKLFPLTRFTVLTFIEKHY